MKYNERGEMAYLSACHYSHEVLYINIFILQKK